MSHLIPKEKRSAARRGETVVFIAALLVGGCMLAPGGTLAEKERAARVGEAYRLEFERREVPELSGKATWREALHRAFLVNGDLEAAYFDWRAALARVDERSAYPNTNLSLGFSYLFSPGNMKAWDRTTVSAQPDPMQNLALPVKVKRAGKVALDEARAAGEKFRATKFELQRKVIVACIDLQLMEEKIRIQREHVELLKLAVQSASDRVQAGGNQQDLLKAQIAMRLAENELDTMGAEHHGMLTMLNGMLGRSPLAEINLPAGPPGQREAPGDDAALLKAAAENNPELAGLARGIEGRKDALELARLQYLPDINPAAAFTGSLSQSIGAMVSIPWNHAAIRAAVEEQRTMLQSAEAMARQKRGEKAASLVAALVALRNHERQVEVLEKRVVPAARQLLGSSRQAYATGTVGFAELIDSQRTLLEARVMAAEARAAREKRLAEVEGICAFDVETMNRPRMRTNEHEMKEDKTR